MCTPKTPKHAVKLSFSPQKNRVWTREMWNCHEIPNCPEIAKITKESVPRSRLHTVPETRQDPGQLNRATLRIPFSAVSGLASQILTWENSKFPEFAFKIIIQIQNLQILQMSILEEHGGGFKVVPNFPQIPTKFHQNLSQKMTKFPENFLN